MFLVQIFKSHPLEPRQWTNDYIVDTTVLDTAVAALALIYAAETSFHAEAVQFEHAIVSNLEPDNNEFQTVPLNSPGDRTNPADNLPLWNTMRVDITAAGGGRPGRKFYRLPLGESEVANYIVDATLRSGVKSTLDGLISDLATLGAPWMVGGVREATEATPFNKVQMRQLHRKRRRSAPA